MRWRAIASGVLAGCGALFYLTPGFAVEHVVARAMCARPAIASQGHGLVQPPPTRPASRPPLEAEHEPARLASDPVEPEPEAKPESAHAHAPAPKTAARAMPAPTSRAATSAPPVGALEELVALRMESLPLCRRYAGPRGPGLVEIVFMGDGTTRVGLSDPYVNTPAGACVARRLGAPTMPFDGGPVVVRGRFAL